VQCILKRLVREVVGIGRHPGGGREDSSENGVAPVVRGVGVGGMPGVDASGPMEKKVKRIGLREAGWRNPRCATTTTY